MEYNTSEILGLSQEEAQKRLKEYGLNTIRERKGLSDVQIFLEQFKNPYLLLLTFTAVLSLFLGEDTDAEIIIGIILLSSFLSFWEERKAYRVIEKLLSMVRTTATVIRDGKEKEIPIEEIVPDDIVILRAGNMVPADGKVLEAKYLFINEALLTGESYPVEKFEGDDLYMGTHVVSGYGVMKVIKTGKNTEYGKIVERLKSGKEETDFERGLKRFGNMLVQVASLLIIVVFAINSYLGKGVMDSFLFALSLGIGITPVLLPMVLSIGLAYAARNIAKKGAITKKLSSIQNFGSMTVLCSDKTGTLTKGKMEVLSFINLLNKEDQKVALFSYLNSYFQSTYKNPIDDAILSIPNPIDISSFEKLDEIPYDFNRRMLSILVKEGDKRILITKGAYSHILEICKYAEINGRVVEIKEVIEEVEKIYKDYSSEGFRIIAVAYKLVDKDNVDYQDEREEILIGFIVIHDPLREDAKELVERLSSLGIELKIITGDNEFVASYIAKKLNLSGGVMSGKDFEKLLMESLSEEALIRKIKNTSIFAELTPIQKERVVNLLKESGQVVGYLGDGINDLLAMRSADVAISVESAADTVKDGADIVLLKQDLSIIADAVVEGRKSFLNTMKYLFMQTSSNFGNVFSMTGASLIIPFLPMLPKQVLTLNFLADVAVMSIPTDRVSEKDTKKPLKWDMGFMKKFMLYFGPLSSVFDYITFMSLLYIFRADAITFRSGWFLESLLTQVFVLLTLRTKRFFLKDFPSLPLVFTVLGVAMAGIILPFTPIGKLLELKPLDFKLYTAVILIVLSYIVSVELLKRFFFSKISN